jgi:hypothetical protein
LRHGDFNVLSNARLGAVGYDMWFQKATGSNSNGFSEEDLISQLSDAIRCDVKKKKAEYYVRLANMSLAMSDKNLGCQSNAAISLVHVKH